jgi:hypothetical protein
VSSITIAIGSIATTVEIVAAPAGQLGLPSFKKREVLKILFAAQELSSP